MRTKQAAIDNGNLILNPQPNSYHADRAWLTAESNNFVSRTDNSRFHENRNIYSSEETNETILNYRTTIENSDSKVNVEFVVCNRQYRINSQNNVVFKSLNRSNLEDSREIVIGHDQFIEDSNAYSDETPIDDDRVFDQSDTDEMSENGIHPVPRGIVNPNYPGFQHLAHTLQDYSSNIENFYHSENDMTDDDVDIEITELAYESENNNQNTTIDSKFINNNFEKKIISSEKNDLKTSLDSQEQNEIPDLIKTVTQNNNNNDIDLFNYELNCSDSDIENNFNTKDIIGDFNKEVEDEIKQLLNYNINIQDDLEELRKDIKDTLAQPIEDTINNISDVVNHVIKKLVENHTDVNEDYPENKEFMDDDSTDINKENEKNTRTEMNLSRPTFLYIDSNTNKIDDAFLSDGKDEIDISEYDPDKLSQNVENTIKQLSTELRKIIPKLDEMRERDKLWAASKKETTSVTTVATDGNSNEIQSSRNYGFVSSVNAQLTEMTKSFRHNDHIAQATIRHLPTKAHSEPRERQKDLSKFEHCHSKAQSNASVRKSSSPKDFDLESFDVYNIETALPKLDLDAIENHIRAAKEAERRKRNDREEIRKRLAMGAEADEYYSLGYTDRPGKKPSLHSRLQSGKNLQICFMNETASDNESQASDLDRNTNNSTKSLSRSSIFSRNSYNHNHPYQTRPLSVNITKHDKISTTVQSGAKLRPSSLTMKSKSRSTHSLGQIELKESDFYALQATLQTEARIALAQAKEMARIQMERSRLGRSVSPVTEMLRRSMQKAGAPLAADRRRVSRQLLTDMNVAQLQVIVNELHSQIESLNDTLVKLLMARDELHMGQDSMLVDIEDLTRYLGVKEQTKKTKVTAKTGMKRLASLVNK